MITQRRHEHQSCLHQSSQLLQLMRGSLGAPHAGRDTSEVPVEEEQLVARGALGRGA